MALLDRRSNRLAGHLKKLNITIRRKSKKIQIFNLQVKTFVVVEVVTSVGFSTVVLEVVASVVDASVFNSTVVLDVVVAVDVSSKVVVVRCDSGTRSVLP